jgi:hypothetical protein
VYVQYYPELYLLNGGYKRFHGECIGMCEPRGYRVSRELHERVVTDSNNARVADNVRSAVQERDARRLGHDREESQQVDALDVDERRQRIQRAPTITQVVTCAHNATSNEHNTHASIAC